VTTLESSLSKSKPQTEPSLDSLYSRVDGEHPLPHAALQGIRALGWLTLVVPASCSCTPTVLTMHVSSSWRVMSESPCISSVRSTNETFSSCLLMSTAAALFADPAALQPDSSCRIRGCGTVLPSTTNPWICLLCRTGKY